MRGIGSGDQAVGQWMLSPLLANCPFATAYRLFAQREFVCDLEPLGNADADHVQRALAGEAEFVGRVRARRLAAMEGDDARSAIGPGLRYHGVARKDGDA